MLMLRAFEEAAKRVYTAGFDAAALSLAIPSSGLPLLRPANLSNSKAAGDESGVSRSVAAMLTARPGYGDAIFVIKPSLLKHQATRVQLPNSRAVFSGAWRDYHPWLNPLHALLDTDEGESSAQQRWRQVRSRTALVGHNTQHAYTELVRMQKRELQVFRKMTRNLQMQADTVSTTEMLLDSVTASLYTQQRRYTAAGRNSRKVQSTLSAAMQCLCEMTTGLVIFENVSSVSRRIAAPSRSFERRASEFQGVCVCV